MKVKSADGISIDFRIVGDGTPALVFVHGWCCDQSYWDAQVTHFAQRYAVVTLDLAGHGESGLGRKAWTMAAFGEDVQAVVRALDLNPVVLVGHSMGGHVVAEAARRMPERVIGLVGVDTFTDIERRPTRKELDKASAGFRTNFREATGELVRSMFAPNSDRALVERVAADMSGAPPEVGLSAAQEAQKQDLAQVFEQVRAPIRCINSDGGTTNVEAARRHSFSFEVVFMTGVGHFVMMEDPKTFNRLLTEIVEELVLLSEGSR